MLVVNDQLRIPDAELQFTYARSPGPGGQNVNKVNSKAVLHWDATRSPCLPEPVRARFLAQQRNRLTTGGELVLSSSRYRDQAKNVQDCLEKLRAMLEAALVVPKPRKATKPSRAARERRLEGKRKTSTRKQGRRAGARDEE